MPWGNRPRLSDEERFEQKVDRTGDCHRWIGGHDGRGYGAFWRDGKAQKAHTVALSMAGIEVPEGMTVDHVWSRGCQHRDCVRIEHLEIASYRENNLRGNNRAALNARMTHCPQGHEFSGDNLRVRPDGRRTCRTCQRTRDRVNYLKRRAQAA